MLTWWWIMLQSYGMFRCRAERFSVTMLVKWCALVASILFMYLVVTEATGISATVTVLRHLCQALPTTTACRSPALLFTEHCPHGGVKYLDKPFFPGFGGTRGEASASRSSLADLDSRRRSTEGLSLHCTTLSTSIGFSF